MAKALEPPPAKRGCILVVSHAHYLSVVAHAVAVAAKLSEDDIRLMLHCMAFQHNAKKQPGEGRGAGKAGGC